MTRRSLRPLLDTLCLLAAFVLALLVRFRFETSTIDVQWYWTSLGLFAGVDLGYLYLRGMYDNGHVTVDRTAVVVDGLVYATFLYLLIAYLVKNTLFSRLTLVYFLVLSFVLQVVLERAVVAMRRHRYARGMDLVPTIVVGAVEDLAAAGLDAPSLQRGLGMRILHTEAGTVAVKSFGQLEALLAGEAPSAVLLASPLPDTPQMVELCLRRYVTVYALGGTVRTLPYPLRCRVREPHTRAQSARPPRRGCGRAHQTSHGHPAGRARRTDPVAGSARSRSPCEGHIARPRPVWAPAPW
jgi:hypothetical protein